MAKGGSVAIIIIILIILIGGIIWLVTRNDSGPQAEDTTPLILPPDDEPEPAGPNPTTPDDIPDQPDSDAVPLVPTTYTIEIISNSYSPSTLEINSGDTVTFVNIDSSSNWPASGAHPTHTIYPESTGKCPVIGGSDFDACRGLSQGESYSFTFNVVGNWKYHNHRSPGTTGTIIVS